MNPHNNQQRPLLATALTVAMLIVLALRTMVVAQAQADDGTPAQPNTIFLPLIQQAGTTQAARRRSPAPPWRTRRDGPRRPRRLRRRR